MNSGDIILLVRCYVLSVFDLHFIIPSLV